QAVLEPQNFFITTGQGASEDRFNRFVVYFEVEKSYVGPLFVRIFDADCAGTLDIDPPNSKILYRVYGGQGINRGLRTPGPDASVLKNEALASLELGENNLYDNQWRSIARLHPADGRLPDGRVVFQLVADGISGKGSNKFQVFISAEEKKNTAIAGLRMSTPVVNLQLPAAPSSKTEIRFMVPTTSEYITISNFDADPIAFATRIHFSSTIRPLIPVKGAKNKAISSTKIKLLEEEKGKPAALLLSSGKTNFIQLWINDDQGKEIPLELPVFLAPANHLPKPKISITPLSDCNALLLDASGTTDQDGDQLAFQWHFVDGSTASGSRIIHDFKDPGESVVRLLVQDDSGFVANNSSLTLPLTINAPPKGHITAPAHAAVNEDVVFDGGKSIDQDGKIIHYQWKFGEGQEENGPQVQHRFFRPGLYQVDLQVEDNGDGLCRTDNVRHTIQINAAPVAKFTMKQVVAPREEVLLDAADSLDSDGMISLYSWDFGDNENGKGKAIKHAWQLPGIYEVRLQVRDNSALSNDHDEVLRKVVVNAPPEPVIIASPLIVAVDSPVLVTGNKSRDPDGRILSYAWNFGDGTTGQGEKTQHAYTEPGEYVIRLTITDDSGVDNASQVSEQIIRV
ncbi:MAG: PKD domain-containing protein, partial [Candidatus Electrothrix sp. AR3]|nr:PKD domain-containing protein [Candidatus Electrothrix sp. AR3]